MAITPAMLKSLREEVDAALAPLATRYALSSLKAGRASYTAGQFTMKIEGVAEGGLSLEAEPYNQATSLGLPKLGFEFIAGTPRYKTIGLNTTGSKVLVERVIDGKQFLYPVETVKSYAALK